MNALCIAPKENFMSLFDGSCFESAQLEIFTFVREHPCRDEWIPLFSDIRILEYLGYRFSLDTWISGYLDIMDIWIHGYLDTWISVFFGYMDTWILWISFFFIIQILDILSKYPDIFGYSFMLPNMEKRQSNS